MRVCGAKYPQIDVGDDWMGEKKHALCSFAVGALGYSLIEIAVRGRTHWSMTLTGGACFSAIHMLCRKRREWRLGRKCAAGALIITAAELSVGLLVNRCLKWSVWDYSDRRFNLMGQICPRFSLYWFLMGAPMVALSNGISRVLDESPQR